MPRQSQDRFSLLAKKPFLTTQKKLTKKDTLKLMDGVKLDSMGNVKQERIEPDGGLCDAADANMGVERCQKV